MLAYVLQLFPLRRVIIRVLRLLIFFCKVLRYVIVTLPACAVHSHFQLVVAQGSKHKKKYHL